jgi:hypothetical protein
LNDGNMTQLPGRRAPTGRDMLLMADLHQAKFAVRYGETQWDLLEVRVSTFRPIVFTTQLGKARLIGKYGPPRQRIVTVQVSLTVTALKRLFPHSSQPEPPSGQAHQ